MEIILSTRNRSKIDQIKSALDGLEITVLSLSEAGIEGDVIEDGNTLEEMLSRKQPSQINKLENGPSLMIPVFSLMHWAAYLVFVRHNGLVRAFLRKTLCDLH